MAYRSLAEAVADLERTDQLVRIREPLDPHLEMAYVHLRVQQAQGPAVLFERVKGCRFPAVSNLFGTAQRARFLLRHGYEQVRKMIELRADPARALAQPWRHVGALWTGLGALPMPVSTGPVLAHRIGVTELPQIQSWPRDGGPFITLPQVYSEAPGHQGPLAGNLGMYRIQLAGNDYARGREVGLHYQIHRGIGVHHAQAHAQSRPLAVSVFVGGPPAHTLAAVMPLPEGLSELTFAGMLAQRRFRYARIEPHLISTDADFVLVGTVDPTRTLPEGPFGDHLGYYSLTHPFPVMDVQAVYHRDGAIWPFTVVGRPPQEDTIFGQLIHELTAPMVPRSIPGLRAMHAVDAAGVHPLLLAIGSERYTPWTPRRPQELLTLANAILGFGQASLAKYLWIVAGEDDLDLKVDDIAGLLQHALARVDWTRDIHFHTRTTMDTLDYSGTGLNQGSKAVIAVAGPPRRGLGRELPNLPEVPGFGLARVVLPGILAVQADPHRGREDQAVAELMRAWAMHPMMAQPDGPWPLAVIVDDAEFTARRLENFLWVTFTRSNPSHDIEGVGSSIEHKHWGCSGTLIIDARLKAHHAPPLEFDPAVVRRVEGLAVAGGPLAGLL